MVGTKVAQATYDTDQTALKARVTALEGQGAPLTEAAVQSLINAAIAAALSKVMTVTFTDNTNDDYKIGH